MLIEYLLYRQNVIGRTHERVSDEVDVFLNGEEDVVVVFRRDGRQSDVLARHVNALVRTKHTVVLHLSHKHRSVVLYNKHVEFAVVEEYMVANLNVLGEVDVRNVYDVVRRIHTRTTEYLNDIACLVLYRLGAASGSHLRTLCVDHKGKVGRNRSYILYNITYPVRRRMRCIHSHDVHSGKEQFAEELNITTAIANRSNNLCLFHRMYIYMFFVCKVTDFLRKTTNIYYT